MFLYLVADEGQNPADVAHRFGLTASAFRRDARSNMERWRPYARALARRRARLLLECLTPEELEHARELLDELARDLEARPDA